jgi:hypothetical protein
MSSGSHSGPIFQSMPTHMGLWDKWVLGWADPDPVRPRRQRADRPARPDIPHPARQQGRHQGQPAAQGHHAG